MPVRLVCPACKGNLNIPDRLLGRAVKCPKCTKVLKTPPPPDEIDIDELDVVDEADPSATPAPALLTFAELNVPPRMQRLIHQALGEGEHLVWLGRPSAKQFMTHAWIAVPFGLLFTAVGAGILIYWWMSSKPAEMHVAFTIGLHLFLSVFLLFGLIFTIAPLWVWAFRAQWDCYVLTNRQALIVGWAKELSWTQFFRCSVLRYTPENLRHMRRRASSLIFQSYTPIGKAKKMNNWWNRLNNRHYGNNQYVQKVDTTMKRGFLYLEEADQVEKLIRQTLLRKI